MVGGASLGRVYVEIPLSARLMGAARTPGDRSAVWSAFFTAVLREQPDYTVPARGQPTPAVPYWGDFVYRKVDWAAVARASTYASATFFRYGRRTATDR